MPNLSEAIRRLVETRAEGEEKMSDEKKDLAAARAEKQAQKAFRKLDATQALNDHEKSQKAFFENRDRLRSERLAREVAAEAMHNPTPELPDDTPLKNVRFSTRIQNALIASGLKTVGEVRELSDATLLSLQDMGRASLAELRETLGLPSTDGVRPDPTKRP